MSLNIFSAGINGSFSSELNSNFQESLGLTCLNHIRYLIQHVGVYSADSEDLWGEAYIDVDGRNNSVNLVYTDATFNTNAYETTSNATSYINHTLPLNQFSNNISSAYGRGLLKDWEVGANVRYKFTSSLAGGSINDTDSHSTTSTSYVLKATYTTQGTTSNVSLDLKTNNSAQVATAKITYNYFDGTSSDVEQSTSSESLVNKDFANPNSSKHIKTIDLYVKSDAAFAQALVDNVASTLSSVSGDDSGWLNSNEISEFTQFTGEPYVLIVELDPKVSPTAGYPSLRGFSVRAL